MRVKLFVFCFLFFLLSFSLFSQTYKVDLKGFGKVAVVKDNDNYTINLGRFGKFNCTGSLEPFALSTKVTAQQLKKFPGYNIYNKIGFEDITLHFGEGGVEIEANVDAKQAFGKVFDMFKISSPTFGVNVALSKEGFKLEGGLNFEDEPIVIDVVTDFSRFTLENFAIGAEWEKGDGALDLNVGVSIQTRWKPTKWDPDIQSVTAFDYNLISQEISASISMTDRWSNPLFLSKLLKEDSVVFTDVAAQIDWPLGSPSPTGFGFYIGHAQLFQLEFAAQLAMTPADRQIALYAHRNVMGMNDFSKILRNGFGLNVPDVFPDDIEITNAEVLFSPNGGEVGEFEIEEGFKLKGQARFMDAVECQVDFYANWNDGFRLYYQMDAAFREFLEREFSAHPKLRYISTQLLNTLEVRQIMLHLESDMSLNMKGGTRCHLRILGEDITFMLEGSFSPSAFKDKLIDEVMKLAGPEVTAVINAVSEGVEVAGRVAIDAVNKGTEEIDRALGDAATIAKHTFHSKEECDKDCVPHLANQLTDKLLPVSKAAVQVFHDNIVEDLVKINGPNPEETRRMREELFLKEWNSLSSKIDRDWERVFSDQSYRKFYWKSSSMHDAEGIFRGVINGKKSEYIAVRDRLFNQLITASMFKLARNSVFVNRKEKVSEDMLFPKDEKHSDKALLDREWTPGNVVLVSGDRRYTFRYQSDGNLVVYKYNTIPVWASNTDGRETDKLVFQGDGNLVLYGAKGNAIWSTGSYGKGAESLLLQNDGNLVLYTKAGKPVWDAGTWERHYRHEIEVDKEWGPGSLVLLSDDIRYSFIYQEDGNLVLYKYNTIPVWKSNTDGRETKRLILQGDGNLVLYDINNRPVWASNSSGKGGAKLILQGDGNLVLYTKAGKPVWDSGTWERHYATSAEVNKEWHRDHERDKVIMASEDKKYMLKLQRDGNLVLYLYETYPLWSSSTDGKGVERALFQGDGNLVLFNGNNDPVWSTGSHGKGGHKLVMQGDGNLVLYNKRGKALWATNTAGNR